MQLTINSRTEGTRRIVVLAGECDLATAPQLQEAVADLRAPEVSELILDVAELAFMDSTGLGVIVGALKRLRETGGVLKIAGAQGAVSRVLEVSGIDRIIPMFADVSTASA